MTCLSVLVWFGVEKETVVLRSGSSSTGDVALVLLAGFLDIIS